MLHWNVNDLLLGENSIPESNVSDDSDCSVFFEGASDQLAQRTLKAKDAMNAILVAHAENLCGFHCCSIYW